MLVAVAGIGKVDASCLVEAEIVGRVELLAVVVRRQGGDRAVRLVTAHGARAAVFAVAADHETSLGVEVHAVGAVARFLPYLGDARGRSIDKNAVFGAVGKVDIALSIGSRPLSEGRAVEKTFKFCIRWDRVCGHDNSLKIYD